MLSIAPVTTIPLKQKTPPGKSGKPGKPGKPGNKSGKSGKKPGKLMECIPARSLPHLHASASIPWSGTWGSLQLHSYGCASIPWSGTWGSLHSTAHLTGNPSGKKSATIPAMSSYVDVHNHPTPKSRKIGHHCCPASTTPPAIPARPAKTGKKRQDPTAGKTVHPSTRDTHPKRISGKIAHTNHVLVSGNTSGKNSGKNSGNIPATSCTHHPPHPRPIPIRADGCQLTARHWPLAGLCGGK